MTSAYPDRQKIDPDKTEESPPHDSDGREYPEREHDEAPVPAESAREAIGDDTADDGR